MGFNFMLRGGEFLWRDGRGWDEPKVIRGIDMELRLDMEGRKEEDQAWLTWRQAKADQLGKGVIGARTFGFTRASAPVIVSMDAHCEVGTNWLAPLLSVLATNRWVQ